jgi:hypothetical protein
VHPGKIPLYLTVVQRTRLAGRERRLADACALSRESPEPAQNNYQTLNLYLRNGKYHAPTDQAARATNWKAQEMPKTATLPATSEAVALLTRALTQGHAVTISLVAPPRVDCTTPPATICSLRFGLTGIEGLILAELTSHPRVSREDMCRAVSHHSKAVSKFGTVSVALCTLRKKMRLHDVDIITDRMQGFRLTAESRES